MNDLSEWACRRLLDTLALVLDFRGRTPKKLGMEWGDGEIRALSANNVEMGNINFSKECYLGSERLYRKWMTRGDAQEGDVVLTTEAPLGNVAQIPDGQRYILSQRAILLRADAEQLSNDYLAHFLRSNGFQCLMRQQSSGTTATGIQRQKLEALPIRFPVSRSEQSTIVEVLSTLDRAIEQTHTLISKQEHIRSGLMQDLLTRGIDNDNNLRSESIHLFKDSCLGRIPTEWDVRSFSECVTISKGQRDPKREPYRNWILVAPDHVESRTGLLLAQVSASDQDAISGKYEFEPGDVVYSKIRPYLRKAILADFRGLCSADMYPLRPRQLITSDFLFMTILGERFSRYAESVSDRSGFPKINRVELADFQIAVPPLGEQQRIGDLYRKQMSYAIVQNRNLSKLRSLKSALMQDLLTGNKCVTPLLTVALTQ